MHPPPFASLATLTFTAALTVLGAPTFVHAQESAPPEPRLELGVDAAVASGGGVDEVHGLIAPRLTINITPRTALTVSGDLFTRRDYFGDSWSDSRIVTAELKRGLWRNDRVALSGLVGGGVGWTEFFQPESRYFVANQPVIVPASRFTTTGGEVTLGVGVEQRIAPRLALREEVRAVLGNVAEFRAAVGVTVPLGRYAPRYEAFTARDGGRPDSLRNGTRLGAIIGAAALSGFVAILGHSLCEGDCTNLGAAVALGAGYGAGGGALIGAIADSLRE